MEKIWKVQTSEAGTKLRAFLRLKLGDTYSARQLKRAIEANLCFVNDISERFASYKLRTGDVVKFDLGALRDSPSTKFEIRNERILYEDASLFIYNKPTGVTSDETGLLALLPEMFLVHRLDRETTGAIIFAKTRKIKKLMSDLFRQHGVNKVYLALVDGVPKKPSGTIDNYLGKISLPGEEPRWGLVGHEGGKRSITRWECQENGRQAALVKCFPETGRTHQIRVHMKEIGYPILGDYRYTKKYRCSFHAKRCMLHALEVAFEHPDSGKMLKVKAPIAKDFNEAMESVIS